MTTKEKIEYFNQRFSTLMNKIPKDYNPAYNVIIEFYTTKFPSSISIFVERSGKTTLVETFEETLDVEKEMMNIASKSPTEEKMTFSFARRQNVINTIDEKKEKEAFDMDGLQRMIQKLTNNIEYLKKNLGERSTYKRPWKTSFRRNRQPPNNPNTSPEEIHIEEFAQDHYCRAHETNHTEKICLAFINMFKVFVGME